MSAVTSEENRQESQQGEWNQDWNQDNGLCDDGGHGMNRIGVLSGLVPLMIGPVTGHGWMTTEVIGLRTGPRTLMDD